MDDPMVLNDNGLAGQPLSCLLLGGKLRGGLRVTQHRRFLSLPYKNSSGALQARNRTELLSEYYFFQLSKMQLMEGFINTSEPCGNRDILLLLEMSFWLCSHRSQVKER